MKKTNELNVKGTSVRVIRVGDEDFICLTDMAAGRGDSVRAADVIKNWLRARYTLEFLGTWESLHNPDFKVVEFDHFRIQAGLPNFVLSEDGIPQPQRLKRLNEIAIHQMKVLSSGPDNRNLLK